MRIAAAPAPAAPKFYTVAEAANLLRSSDDTVRRRIADGTLAATRFGGKVLIPATAIEQLVGTTRPAAPAAIAPAVSPVPLNMAAGLPR